MLSRGRFGTQPTRDWTIPEGAQETGDEQTIKTGAALCTSTLRLSPSAEGQEMMIRQSTLMVLQGSKDALCALRGLPHKPKRRVKDLLEEKEKQDKRANKDD